MRDMEPMHRSRPTWRVWTVGAAMLFAAALVALVAIPRLTSGPFGPFSITASSLVGVGGTIFLSGAVAAEGPLSRPVGVWTSGDGGAWEALPLAPEAEVRVATGVQGSPIFGGRIGGDGGDAMLWRSDAPPP
jgi:hypothetical protein